jgi:hypothetical protein
MKSLHDEKDVHYAAMFLVSQRNVGTFRKQPVGESVNFSGSGV